MSISQSALAWLYLYALILGMCLGAIYDLLRITRVFLGVHYSRRAAKRLQEIRLPFLSPYRKKKENRALGIVVFFEDLFFCIFAGIAMILLFYIQNNGKIRFPAFLCAGAGILLYRATLGRLVMLFSEVIAFVIETAVRYTVFFLLYPVRKLAKFIKTKVQIAVNSSVQARRKSLRRRFTASETGRGKRNACGLIPTDIPKSKTLKRGKQIVTGKEKTVQPHAAHARASRRSGRGIHRNICK
ncbi:MAG: spore cortex biosynthesis protein YabQ [Clostridia bacterium]|nr:spore cortex biosynthesis protein YabQ [Clostridia bacterium]MBQ7347748.1 spore cortex biosynthesis protein YabQ [Clostridia bacterium]